LNVVEWHFGFHRPYIRNIHGKLDYRGIFGHCEAWGYTEDETWVFLDPQGLGFHIRIAHRLEDVQDAWAARIALCDSILRIKADDPKFALPLHGQMTCASICGALVGIRALLPSALRRKLLRNGAEVIHEAERRSRGPQAAHS
jgi:hypothetical protein